MDLKDRATGSAGIPRGSSTRHWFVVLLAVAMAVAGFGPVSASVDAETLVTFDGNAGEYPEGVAVDSEGNVYVSLTPHGLLVRIAPGQSEVEQIGAIDLEEGDLGLTGLAVDSDGNVYGAVVSANPDFAGVWRFDVDTGNTERVAGTESLGLANGIAFDDADTMYVTDSAGGSIWAAAPGEPAELWLDGSMLAGDQSIGLPFPLGVNGIAVTGRTLYVGVTEQGTILAVPIEEDGSAGEPEIVAEFSNDEGPKAVDGVAIDSHGNLYVTFVIDHEIVRILADGTIETIATSEDGLDAPASIAIGPNAEGVESAFVTNFSAAMEPFLTSTGIGPGILVFGL